MSAVSLMMTSVKDNTKIILSNLASKLYFWLNGADIEDDLALKKFIEDVVKCSICHDTMTKPVTLICQHSFCRGCLNKCRSTECPLCRNEFGFIPPGTNKLLSEICKRMGSEQNDDIGDGPVSGEDKIKLSVYANFVKQQMQSVDNIEYAMNSLLHTTKFGLIAVAISFALSFIEIISHTEDTVMFILHILNIILIFSEIFLSPVIQKTKFISVVFGGNDRQKLSFVNDTTTLFRVLSHGHSIHEFRNGIMRANFPSVDGNNNENNNQNNAPSDFIHAGLPTVAVERHGVYPIEIIPQLAEELEEISDEERDNEHDNEQSEVEHSDENTVEPHPQARNTVEPRPPALPMPMSLRTQNQNSRVETGQITLGAAGLMPPQSIRTEMSRRRIPRDHVNNGNNSNNGNNA